MAPLLQLVFKGVHPPGAVVEVPVDQGRGAVSPILQSVVGSGTVPATIVDKWSREFCPIGAWNVAAKPMATRGERRDVF